jgi:hypothetical protein
VYNQQAYGDIVLTVVELKVATESGESEEESGITCKTPAAGSPALLIVYSPGLRARAERKRT